MYSHPYSLVFKQTARKKRCFRVAGCSNIRSCCSWAWYYFAFRVMMTQGQGSNNIDLCFIQTLPLWPRQTTSDLSLSCQGLFAGTVPRYIKRLAAYLVVGAVLLPALAALQQVCGGPTCFGHLVLPDGLLGENIPQLFELITGHFLQKHTNITNAFKQKKKPSYALASYGARACNTSLKLFINEQKAYLCGHFGPNQVKIQEVFGFPAGMFFFKTIQKHKWDSRIQTLMEDNKPGCIDDRK